MPMCATRISTWPAVLKINLDLHLGDVIHPRHDFRRFEPESPCLSLGSEVCVGDAWEHKRHPSDIAQRTRIPVPPKEIHKRPRSAGVGVGISEGSILIFPIPSHDVKVQLREEHALYEVAEAAANPAPGERRAVAEAPLAKARGFPSAEGAVAKILVPRAHRQGVEPILQVGWPRAHRVGVSQGSVFEDLQLELDGEIEETEWLQRCSVSHGGNHVDGIYCDLAEKGGILWGHAKRDTNVLSPVKFR